MKLIKLSTLILTLTMLKNFEVKSQSLKTVGNGFNHKIHLLTHDPDGNLYALTTNVAEDSFVFYLYTYNTKKWSMITRLKNNLGNNPNLVEYVTFFVLNGEIYCTDLINFNSFSVLRFRNNNWQNAFTTNRRINNENFQYWGTNKVTFSSYSYDIVTNVNGKSVNGVFAYDGTNVFDLNSQNLSPYISFTHKDSVYLIQTNPKDAIWAKDSSATSSYSKYLDFNNYISWLALTDSGHYLFSFDSIFKFHK